MRRTWLEKKSSPVRHGGGVHTSGYALGSTLMMCSLMCLLALTLGTLANSSLNFQLQHLQTQRLSLLADSATASVLAALLKDATYGTHGESMQQMPDPDTAVFASFDTRRAAAWGIEACVNNLQNGQLVTVDGHVVAPHLATVSVRAQRGKLTHQVDSALILPYYSIAVGTTGSLQASGGLTVGGYPSMPDLSTLDPSKLLPADMASNSTAAKAVVLEGPSLITGDVRAEGGIILDPAGGSQVKGSVCADAAPAALPSVQPSQFDPGRDSFAPQALVATPTVPAPMRMQGPVTVKGPLQLDDGLLYVDGDVSVPAGIQGIGAVVATGNITVQGSSNLKSSDQVALVAGHDVNISGGTFQGLIYAGHAMAASHVNLFGSFVSGNNGLGLDAVNLIHVPTMTALQLPNIAVVGAKADWVAHTYQLDPNFDPQLDVGAWDGNGNRVPLGATGATWYPTPPSAIYQGTLYTNLVFSWCIIAQRSQSGQMTYDLRNWSCMGAGQTYTGAVDSGFMPWSAMLQYLQSTTPGLPWGFDPAEVSSTLAAMKSNLDQQMAAPRPPMPAVTLDFNRLIAPGDRLRLLMWRAR
jgi:hypothetical protein